MSDEDKALELWRRWFDFSGDPYEADVDAIELWCFFCGKNKDDGHASDCVYVQAAKLLGVTCK